MSHYVYEVSGDRTVTVMTGFNCRRQSFFADVFLGTDLNVPPIHSWDAQDHRKIAGCLELAGVPMHREAYDALCRDQNDAIFDLSNIERRFEVLPSIEIQESSTQGPRDVRPVFEKKYRLQ